MVDPCPRDVGDVALVDCASTLLEEYRHIFTFPCDVQICGSDTSSRHPRLLALLGRRAVPPLEDRQDRLVFPCAVIEGKRHHSELAVQLPCLWVVAQEVHDITKRETIA